MKTNMVLQLATMPASNCGLVGFRKEVLKVGHYIKESTNQTFDITVKVLDDLVATFDKWILGGNKVAVPLGHERAHLPEFNRGWVRSLVREDDSLFAILELDDPALALTTDVSVCIESERTDGKGIKYKDVLTHIALTCEPVVGKLTNFMKLSLGKGNNMDFKEAYKKIAVKLGIKDAEPTEEAVEKAFILALDAKKPVVPAVIIPVVDPLTKLVSDNRAMKLSQLVKAGLITPAVNTLLVEKYVKLETVALELSKGNDDGFDTIYNVLVQNRPVKLDELTGVQSLELAAPGAVQPNAMEKEVAKRRTEAGLKN